MLIILTSKSCGYLFSFPSDVFGSFLVPTIQFEKTAYFANEESGTLNVLLMRSGDLSYTSSVRCYTRYLTAQVERDFKERPDTDKSLVLFYPGEYRKICPVTIVNDVVFEGKEMFRLRLGSVDKASRIGKRNTSIISILDSADSKC